MDKTLIEEIKDLVEFVDQTHRYSMSKIYGLHNTVFNKNETPQSCASCLIRKVSDLRTWLEMEESKKPDLSLTNLESVDLVKKSRKKKGE